MSDDYCDGGGFSSDGFGLALCMGAFNPRPPLPSPDPTVIIHYEDNSHLIATANEHIRSWQRHAENLEAENNQLHHRYTAMYREANFMTALYAAYQILFHAAIRGFTTEPEFAELQAFANKMLIDQQSGHPGPTLEDLKSVTEPLKRAIDRRRNAAY